MYTGTTGSPAETAPAPFRTTITARELFGAAASLTDDALTERSRRIWSAGDYDRIAAGFRHEAEAFVARLALRPDMQVLDVACGSGNLTIPAGRTGAETTGLDLVAPLLAQATVWAEQERLAIAFDQGNAEQLPYEDQRYDVVMSMFGTMFAARPERVVAELARVTRPNGRVALANWTRRSFIGQMFAIHGEFAPPPANIPSPLLWGDEAVLHERFAARDWRLELTPRILDFRYPISPADTAALFINVYGPTVRTMEVLDESQRQAFAEKLTAHWTSHQQGDARETVVHAEYLEVIATRR